MRIREKMKHQTNVILSLSLFCTSYGCMMMIDDAGMGLMARGACTAAPWHHHFGRGSASKPPRARWAELARSLRDVIKRGRGLCNRITYSGHGGDLCAPVEGFWSERAETDDEAGPAAWSCSCSLLLLLLLPLPCPPPFPLPLSQEERERERDRGGREIEDVRSREWCREAGQGSQEAAVETALWFGFSSAASPATLI